MCQAICLLRWSVISNKFFLFRFSDSFSFYIPTNDVLDLSLISLFLFIFFSFSLCNAQTICRILQVNRRKPRTCQEQIKTKTKKKHFAYERRDHIKTGRNTARLMSLSLKASSALKVVRFGEFGFRTDLFVGPCGAALTLRLLIRPSLIYST